MAGLPQVSVIIPMYNSEKYLRECLDSVRASVFENFEALLVDDGSTDSTKAIAEEYCKEDGRFRLIALSHGGVSRGRNAAIENARGEYVLFVDSDDFIHPLMIEHLMNGVLNEGMESCIEPFRRIDGSEDTRELFSEIRTEDETLKAFNHEESIALYFNKLNHFGRIGGFFVKREIAARGFRTDLFTGEDTAFTYECAVAAERMMLLNEELYFYRQHDNNVFRRIDYDAVCNKVASFDILINGEDRAGRPEYSMKIRKMIAKMVFSYYIRLRQAGDVKTARRIRRKAYTDWRDKYQALSSRLKIKCRLGYYCYPVYMLLRKRFNLREV